MQAGASEEGARRRKVKGAGFFYATLLMGVFAHAVCLNGHPSVSDEIKNAKAVVVARVNGQREIPETSDGFYSEGTIYKVKSSGRCKGALALYRKSSVRIAPADFRWSLGRYTCCSLRNGMTG